MEVGVLVKITEPGHMYTEYVKWLEVKAKEYIEEYKKVKPQKIKIGTKGKIIAKGYHGAYKKRKLYLIETEEGPILIGKEGIEECEKP